MGEWKHILPSSPSLEHLDCSVLHFYPKHDLPSRHLDTPPPETRDRMRVRYREREDQGSSALVGCREENFGFFQGLRRSERRGIGGTGMASSLLERYRSERCLRTNGDRGSLVGRKHRGVTNKKEKCVNLFVPARMLFFGKGNKLPGGGGAL